MHQILARIDRLKASCSLVPSSAPSELPLNYDNLVETHYTNCTTEAQTNPEKSRKGWLHKYKDQLADLVDDHLNPLWISKLLILLNASKEKELFMDIKNTLEEELEKLFNNTTSAADAYVEAAKAQEKNNATEALSEADQEKLQRLRKYLELLNKYKGLIDKLRMKIYAKNFETLQSQEFKGTHNGKNPLLEAFRYINNTMIETVKNNIEEVEFLQGKNAKRWS